MQYIKIFLISFILVVSTPNFAGDESKEENLSQAREFFDDYLAVYNRRFGHPERSVQFRTELIGLVHDELMISPPNSPPQVLTDLQLFAKSFEGFVTGLEKKGAVRLQWKNVELKELAPNKILANNIGHGMNAEGELVYETVSLYLLFKVEGQWKIALFSPYLPENTLDID